MRPEIILYLLPILRRKKSLNRFSASSPTHLTHLSISFCNTAPNCNGNSIAAFIVTTATGFKSDAKTRNPYCADSKGIDPPPANASNTAGVLSPHICSQSSCTRFTRSGVGGVLYSLVRWWRSSFLSLIFIRPIQPQQILKLLHTDIHRQQRTQHTRPTKRQRLPRIPPMQTLKGFAPVFIVNLLIQQLHRHNFFDKNWFAIGHG
jgi:hypothetical protein